ncbi:MAG TPA: hypothetical protein DEP51_05025 [Clostridiales bacterium]|nr:hypothetical protein [Clostridiales bacterium]
MSWESDLIGERTRERRIDTNNDESNKPKILDYAKMNNEELIELLEGTLDSLGVLEEMVRIGEDVEKKAVKDVFKDYQNIKRVLSNRELTSDVSSIIQNIYDELIKKFENLGIQQDNGMLIHD